MITLHDVETAVAALLKSAGHTVTANEIAEGFDKPTFFINIFQNGVLRENPFMELVSVGIELKYFPDTETREMLVTTADALRELLTAAPLAVGDRFLSIAEILFDTEDGVLLAYFELEFMRETAAAPSANEKIQNLEIEVRQSGTSTGSD
jgi:hypothetical protein